MTTVPPPLPQFDFSAHLQFISSRSDCSFCPFHHFSEYSENEQFRAAGPHGNELLIARFQPTIFRAHKANPGDIDISEEYLCTQLLG